MNRIDRLFKDREGCILSIYMTAGYPALEDTVTLLELLQENGAHMVEVGIPFSDPLADGPVIQHSSQMALRNGMSLDLLFRQLEKIRLSIRIPLILMGYLNPILQMGMEVFLDRCRNTGIDGVIIPDLPLLEFRQQYRSMFREKGIHMPMLITPHTGGERIRQVAESSGGFLYMVAEASTTGARRSVGEHQVAYFSRIRDMNLSIPTLIGFGISNRHTFETACSYARGAIIGSAFIKAISPRKSKNQEHLENKVSGFLGSILSTGS